MDRLGFFYSSLERLLSSTSLLPTHSSLYSRARVMMACSKDLYWHNHSWDSKHVSVFICENESISLADS